jgi:hypothetical protein
MLRPTDRILGPPRGDAAQARGFARAQGALRTEDVAAYIDESFRLAPKVGIDPAILIAQSAHETDNWRSAWWRDRLNPAGIGVTGDPAQDAASGTWRNGTDAARAQITHLALYTGVDFLDYRDLDPRYQAALDAGMFGVARTLDGLAGRWATDTAYASKVAARGNVIFPGIANQGEAMTDITYGKVPHPPFEDRPIWKPEGAGQNNLGKRSVEGVVWHRILGTLWGTDGYFRQSGVKALTDYGVGVAATDGAGRAGQILRWNDPLGNQSGWASGPVSSPYGDGLAFLEDHGWDLDIVNRDQASIEISGMQTTPLDDAARDAIAGLTAYWADQKRIPWSDFPIIPGKGYSFVRWHREFTIGTGKECPFSVVMNETAALIERARRIMKQYQTSVEGPPDDDEPPDVPEYAPLAPPDFLTPKWINGGEDAAFENGVKVFSLRRRWQARVETPRLQHAGPDAPEVGPPLPAGKSTIGVGVYKSHGAWFVLTEWGERLRMADMSDTMIPAYPEKEAA